MRPGREQYVIVGNGVAGNEALDVIRRLKPAARIVLVADEPHPFYSACVLSDYVAGDTGKKGVFLKRTADYDGVELKLGETVTAIDARKQRVFLGKGSIPYDRLILSLGGDAVVPPVPGASGRGVAVLKTLRDAEKLIRSRAPEAVVVGSGPTGVEAAIALTKRGVKVTLIELLGSVLPTLFDPDVGRKLEHILTEHAVRVHTGERVEEVLRTKGSVSGVRTDQREISCRLVLFAVGVRPRTALAADSGIAVGKRRGVAVNARMETNMPGVYACGDCAEYVTDAGTSVVRQLWSTARRMGRTAGLNAAGHAGTYADTDPGTVVDLFGTVAASVGLQGGALGGTAHVIERQTQAGYRRIILGGGHVVGAQFIGNLDDAWAVQAMRGRAWEPSGMRLPMPGFPAYHWLSRVETRG